MSINGVSYGKNHENVNFEEITRREITNFNMSDDDLDKLLAEKI